jgi:hypothetical protein
MTGIPRHRELSESVHYPINTFVPSISGTRPETRSLPSSIQEIPSWH